MEDQLTKDFDWRQAVKRPEAIGAIAAGNAPAPRAITESDLQNEIQEMVIELILLGRQRGRPKNEDHPNERK